MGLSSTCNAIAAFPFGTFTNFQCCGSGSGIRCYFDPWIRDPGWKKPRARIRDLGSGMNIPYHIFEDLVSTFWVKVLLFFYADPDP
jgi:hypothetical protein